MKHCKNIEDKLINLIKKGTPIIHACAAVGIDNKTYYNWLQKFPKFRSRVRATESAIIQRNIDYIERAARGDEDKPGDWRAAAWHLEKRFPKAYGSRAVEIELSGKMDVTLEQLVDGITKAKENDDGKSKS